MSFLRRQEQKLLVSLTCVVFALSLPTTGWTKASAWEGTITIPTYGWSDDVNPKFWALEDQIKLSTTIKGAIVYPYSMQDHLSRTKVDRTYKALFLENEYLKVTCLPELGGRLHSVLDKTTGQETFHCNQVIKPSMIAMRGAFISGGVEWNAGPQAHTVTVVSPVDALIGTNADGSAYLEVSNLEQTLRTRWTVRVTLHPGRAYLDEQMRIFNPVDAVSPYYFWNCTAFPCRKGTRFLYPMTLGTDHNGVNFFNWPVHEGRDLSWLKNYPEASSIFAVDCTFDFFGAYDVDADRGVVQVADHYELGGKKAWTWGTSDSGLAYQKNLTDDDGPYIEVQSGPLPTQSDYGMLLPRQQVTWREWWYPVHGLGEGFEFATKDLAVQTIHQGDGLQLRLFATGRFPGATCVISRARSEFRLQAGKNSLEPPVGGSARVNAELQTDTGEPLIARKLNLDPKAPQIVTLSPDPKAPVDVTVKTAKGTILAAFTTPLPIPKTDPPQRPAFMDKPDGQLTTEEKYLKALKLDLATNRKKAREYYEKALADDAEYAPALRALAVLDTEAGLYEDAIARLQKAVQRDPGDGVAWYFLGVNYLRTHNPTEALRCAREATRCTGTGALAFDLAGRAHAALGESRAALDAFQKATRMDPKDPLANDHWLLAQYAAGDTAAAFKSAQRAVAQDSTDLVPRALLALQGDSQMKSFVKEAREFVGEDDFEMLETSLTFAEMGLAKEAAKLLAAVCIDAVPEEDRSPLPMYYLAWLTVSRASGPRSEGETPSTRDAEAAKTWLSRAAATHRDFVFPSRPEELEVLGYALRANPGDAYAHLHLGNLYAHLGRSAEAVDHWQKAVDLNRSLSVAYRNLGLYAWATSNDLPKAEQSYRKAIAARPKDQTLYRDLAEILMAQSKRPEAIKLLASMPSEGLPRADILIMLAQAYEDERRYDETIHLLESTPYFVNWEGQTITWDIFHRAHMKRGQNRFEGKDFAGALQDFEAALTYPGNIGAGRSNRPQEADAQYWKGKALQGLGRLEDAKSAWKEGAAGPEGRGDQSKYQQLCREALEL
jgi:tetratricopeptide (TPR) repeat protein